MSQNETTSDVRGGHKRFTMPVIILHRDSEPHPGSVNMLDRSELNKLTQILHLDNTGMMQTEYIPRIENLIQNLPKRLRRSRPLSLGFKTVPADLCELHSRLNADIISNIFYFIQVEVTEHFRLFDQWPELCHPVEAEVLRRLRTLKGMWTKPGSIPEPIYKGWPYQINGCRACMLARIASDMDALRNLRVVILSRTRTRKNHRPRTLMGFVDECINQFQEEEKEQMFNVSSQLAFGMKAARKACTRAELQSRGLAHRRSHRDPKGKAPMKQINEHKSLQDSNASLPTVDIWEEDDDRVDVGVDAVDVLVEMYRNIGVKEPVPEAMVSPLEYRKSRDEIDGISEQFAGMDLSNLVPPKGISKENSNRTSKRVTVERPPIPEFVSSVKPSYEDGSDSDWLDDVCTDSDEKQVKEASSRREPKSAAETTWSLVCDQQNMI
ncbi:hypothetical protein PENSTE_c033G08828 [Penicillium steckii]|uniref:Uncharacterized protein n=1 Tax=Penicillium steckii TaxID=303698 RepID=A0A1V6SL84_9EURO|nr:hypothetical protein PENSTE_c033G08828 [Penicillium steckii]